MKREQVLLAVLAAAKGRPYTPVQLQKAMFLISENLPRLFSKDSEYDFIPYDYGPFDAAVYTDAESLDSDGLAEITRAAGKRWKQYAASEEGLQVGSGLLDKMSESRREYIDDISKWVRKQNFEQLVKAIYDEYPEMKKNSIFQG